MKKSLEKFETLELSFKDSIKGGIRGYIYASGEGVGGGGDAGVDWDYFTGMISNTWKPTKSDWRGAIAGWLLQQGTDFIWNHRQQIKEFMESPIDYTKRPTWYQGPMGKL